MSEASPARARRELARDLALLAPNLAKLLWRLLRNPKVPRRSKIVVGLAAGYFAVPFDLLPDVIPVLGQMDDLLMAAWSLHHLMRTAGRDVVLEAWDGSPEAFELLEAVLEWGAELVPRPLRRLFQ